MARPNRVPIESVQTGVPGLDAVLGGGIPVYSTTMLVGPPGVGKTTLAHQIVHGNASGGAKALYFAALGEPAAKMLRYQQQFDFFDASKVDSAIIYREIGDLARREGLRPTLESIAEQVAATGPSFVVVDSFRGLADIGHSRGESVYGFVHDLSAILGIWSTTVLLLGEYSYQETQSLPEFSAADGIIHLDHQRSGNATVGKLEAVKMRGRATLPGRHTFRISSAGVEVFPRMLPLADHGSPLPAKRDRVTFGVTGLDSMLGGGIPRGEAALIAGSSGTGKTLLALHFMAEGARRGEPGVMVTFEENPQEHERKAAAFGWDLALWQRQGLLRTIYLRPMDLSVDEVLSRVHERVRQLKARRVAINSISGFEMVLAPSDEPDFRESLFRLISTLSSEGVTTILTTEIPNVFGDLSISTHRISFLADNAIILRYAEIQSQLRKVVVVVKMRTSRHDTDLRQYRISDKGIVVEGPFTEYSGVLSGIPTLRSLVGTQPFTAGLADQEESLMHVLLALHAATAEQLAEAMSLDLRQTQELLDKLLDTGYVVRAGARYRVSLVTPEFRPRGG